MPCPLGALNLGCLDSPICYVYRRSMGFGASGWMSIVPDQAVRARGRDKAVAATGSRGTEGPDQDDAFSRIRRVDR